MAARLKRTKRRKARSKQSRARPSFGCRLISGLTGLRDALRAGERIEERFTVRTVGARMEKPRMKAVAEGRGKI
jgi:hypothetical protein